MHSIYFSVLAVTLLVPVAPAQQPNELGASERPVWSPDGRRIAFNSTRDGNHEIYVMAADGSDPTRITRNTFTDVLPTWSPDGSRIAFASIRLGDPYLGPLRSAIFVVQPDDPSAGETQLSNRHFDGADFETPRWDDTYPFWSPRGRIGFLSTRANGWRELFTMAEDGSDVRRLSYHGHDHWNPSWSPDGALILYDAHADGRPEATGDGSWELWTIDADGGRRTNVTRNPHGEDYDAAFSPDGFRIAYSISRAGRGAGLYFINADGSNAMDEPLGQANAFWPSWSPDGTRIAFTSTRDGQREIYVMDANGSGVRRLTFSRPER